MSAQDSHVSEPTGQRFHEAFWRFLHDVTVDQQTLEALLQSYRSLDGKERLALVQLLEFDGATYESQVAVLFARILSLEAQTDVRDRITTWLSDRINRDAKPPKAYILQHGSRGKQLFFECSLFTSMRLVTEVQTDESNAIAHIRSYTTTHDTGPQLDELPFDDAIEELALAVIAHKRKHKELPDGAWLLSPLLTPRISL